jgi:NET1-associated nuclear protein 1 (U3 small nucleolar RNA-associated protein 17)
VTSYATFKVTLKRGGTVVACEPERIKEIRDIASMQMSHDGAYLIAACKGGGIFIAATVNLAAGFAVIEPNQSFTALAVHPSELSLATGDKRGRIQIWYPFDAGWWADFFVARAERRPQFDGVITAPSRVLHWHAHAVASLSYTPNGAYLTSGGEEAVLVFWQIESGHKEFVPRLGAPIVHITVSHSGDEVAVVLSDASALFVDAQQLKAKRSIASIKIGAGHAGHLEVELSARRADASGIPAQHLFDTPLAAQPNTTTLVLPSSHPSSVQFYSPTTASHILELEVAPSNRISRAEDTPIEPARVERVAFAPASAWLATLDAWRTEHFAEESYLKLWSPTGAAIEVGYKLDTRIDRPHGGHRVTGMAFASVPEVGATLATCGLDGQTRLWTCPKGPGSWRCHSAFGYRDLLPADLAWSADGSLLAVAYPRVVVLWAVPSCEVVGTFASPAASPFFRVAFAGAEGETLVAGGESGIVAWDVVRAGEETLRLGCLLSHLLARPGSDTVIALETLPPSYDRTEPVTTAFVVNLVRRTTVAKDLPAAVRQAALIDSPFGGGGDDDASGPALALVTFDGSVGLAGDHLRRPVAAPSLPIDASLLGARTLFDDLFGTSRALTSKVAIPAVGHREGETGLPAVLQAPAHVIPPLTTIWRDLLPLPPPPSHSTRQQQDQEAMEVDDVPAAAVTRETASPPMPVYEIAGLDELFASLSTG